MEVTVIVAELLSSPATLAVFAETERVAAPTACVTVIVFDGIPLPDTITVAVRSTIVGFADAVNVSVLLPVAVAGLTANQAWLDAADHVVFEVTLTVAVLPSVPPTLAVVAERITPGISCIFIKSFH